MGLLAVVVVAGATAAMVAMVTAEPEDGCGGIVSYISHGPEGSGCSRDNVVAVLK